MMPDPTSPTRPRPSYPAICPNCSQGVDAHNRHCPHCGVDLALAAILAENALAVSNLPTGMPVVPEVLVPRLGEYLIAKGMLNQAQLDEALRYQQEKIDSGEPLLLGQALLALEYLDREKLDQAITEQILELQAALRQANRRLEQRVRERTAELQHALNKLTELNQLKSNFISNISHELRTPLTHIKGYLELLLDRGLGPVTEDQSHALSVMYRASQRLENLISDLLRISMSARGEFTLNMTSLSLPAIMHSVEAQSESKASTRKITLKTRMPGELPPVRGDKEKLTWVLMQLVDNAVKFTEPGGQVVISAKKTPQGVCLDVTDTGVGIPEDRLDEIFEPFHQLDGSSTRRHEGTGLGLALVRRIVEAHGALIRVRSKEGQGTRFEFTLPTNPESIP